MIKNNLIVFFIDLIYKLKEPLFLALARRSRAHKYYEQKDPLVSIIIATYNRSSILIERTIPSLLRQTYANIEIIIVGDNCIDDTKEKIANVKDERVKFYDLDKRGRYPNNIKDRWFVQGTKPRNVGMSLADGMWFVFISDDEILYPNHIETLLRAAQIGDYEFISAAYEEERNGARKVIYPSAFDPNQPNFYCGGMQTWLYRSYLKCFKWNIHSWRKSINRPVDYDLCLRFKYCGVKMGCINTVVGLNPVVEGTDTVGYEAALIADKLGEF